MSSIDHDCLEFFTQYIERQIRHRENVIASFGLSGSIEYEFKNSDLHIYDVSQTDFCVHTMNGVSWATPETSFLYKLHDHDTKAIRFHVLFLDDAVDMAELHEGRWCDDKLRAYCTNTRRGCNSAGCVYTESLWRNWALTKSKYMKRHCVYTIIQDLRRCSAGEFVPDNDKWAKLDCVELLDLYQEYQNQSVMDVEDELKEGDYSSISCCEDEKKKDQQEKPQRQREMDVEDNENEYVCPLHIPHARITTDCV